MSTAPRLEFRLDPRAGAAFGEFARRAGPKVVEQFTKKLAFSAVRQTTQGLGGRGAVERVDSGRLRAAWSVAAEEATGQAAGSKSVEDTNPLRPGDGTATTTGAAMDRTITLTNRVEYGPEIEFGTPQIAAGLHLTRAVLLTRKSADRVLGALLRRAWRA
jgi:hypothetical protein